MRLLSRILSALLFTVALTFGLFAGLALAQAEPAATAATAPGLFDVIGGLFNSPFGQAALSSGLGVILLKLAAEPLAELAARVPLIGPVLSKTVLIVAGEFTRYLNTRVPEAAQSAVMATEERYQGKDVSGPAKLEAALEHLRRDARPIAYDHERLEQAVNAALLRMRAEGYELKKAA